VFFGDSFSGNAVSVWIGMSVNIDFLLVNQYMQMRNPMVQSVLP